MKRVFDPLFTKDAPEQPVAFRCQRDSIQPGREQACGYLARSLNDLAGHLAVVHNFRITIAN